MALGAILAVGAAALAGAAWLLRSSNRAEQSMIPQLKAALLALPVERRLGRGPRPDALGGLRQPGGGAVMLYGDEQGSTLNLYAVARFKAASVTLSITSEPGKRKQLPRHLDDPPDYIRYEQEPPKWLGQLRGQDWSIDASPLELLNLLDIEDLSTLSLTSASWAQGDPILAIYTTPEGLSCNVRVALNALEPGWIEQALLPWLERLATVSACAQTLLSLSEPELLARCARADLDDDATLATQALERLGSLEQAAPPELRAWLVAKAPLLLFIVAIEQGLLGADDLRPSKDYARLIDALEACAPTARSREQLLDASVMAALLAPQGFVDAMIDRPKSMGERYVRATILKDERFLWLRERDLFHHAWSQEHLTGLWQALSRAPELDLAQVLSSLGGADALSISSAAGAQAALSLMRARLDTLDDPWAQPWLRLSIEALTSSYDKARAQWSDIIERHAPPTAIPLLIKALNATDSELDRQLFSRLIQQLGERHAPAQGELPSGQLTLIEGHDAPQGRLSLTALSEEEGALSLSELPDSEEE